MTTGSQRAGLAFRLRHPRTTVRWRLTLLYGGLFLVSGAALLAITYTLVEHATVDAPGNVQRAFIKARVPPNFFSRTGSPPKGQLLSGTALGRNAQVAQKRLHEIQRLVTTPPGRIAFAIVGSEQRIADLHQLVIESSIALAIMALISAALGWLVAGRVLSPLRTMTVTAQQISEASLNRRLAMRGPRDELRKLADTIDGLLGRLEGAFDAQRRFVANASHELRTPLTTTRALLEMTLSDPRASVETFRETCRQVLEEGEQQEQLIDALLALAQGQRGIGHREPVDLAVVLGEVLHAHEPDAAAQGLHLDVSLDPAPTTGDRRLIERLASNLLENAIRHNTPDGRVGVLTESRGGEAVLGVVNTGPVVPAHEVERLLQPFQRLAPERVGHGEGLGLGLSIVASIANAHAATLDVHPGAEGGLEIELRFPSAPYSSPPATPDDDARSVQPAIDPAAPAAAA